MTSAAPASPPAVRTRVSARVGAIAESAARYVVAGQKLSGLLVRMQVSRAPQARE